MCCKIIALDAVKSTISQQLMNEESVIGAAITMSTIEQTETTTASPLSSVALSSLYLSTYLALPLCSCPRNNSYPLIRNFHLCLSEGCGYVANFPVTQMMLHLADYCRQLLMHKVGKVAGGIRW